jgi:lysophospholipase L1-like esterase
MAALRLSPICLLLALSSVTQTALAQDPKRFAREIDAFSTADAANPPPKNAILFVGSSTLRLWKTLAADFPDRKVFNRGFGGSQMSDAIYYFDRIVAPYQPKLIVLYEGANDIADRKTPEQVFNDFKTFVAKVHEQLPRTRLDYISILTTPIRAAQVEQVKEANRLIREFIAHDAKLEYIDAFPAFLGPDGKPDPKLFLLDRLHPNAKGYAIMQAIIAPYLAKN